MGWLLGCLVRKVVFILFLMAAAIVALWYFGFIGGG